MLIQYFFPMSMNFFGIVSWYPLAVQKLRDHFHVSDRYTYGTMTESEDRLTNLGVLPLQGFDIQPSVDQICETFTEKCVVHWFCKINLD